METNTNNNNSDNNNNNNNVNTNNSCHTDAEMALLNEEIATMNKYIKERLIDHSEQREGSYPTIKWLMDLYLCFKDYKPEYKDFTYPLKITMITFIGERMEYILESASAVYNLSENQFHEYVNKYIEKNEIPDIKQNSEDIIKKRTQIIENIKLTKKQQESSSSSSSNHNTMTQEQIREFLIKEYKKSNPNKKHCFICGDNEDEIKLIEIPNNEYENKNMCIDCMEIQKKKGAKFSKIKDNKCFFMNLNKNK